MQCNLNGSIYKMDSDSEKNIKKISTIEIFFTKNLS